jgi:hypothetical protein
MAKHKRQENEAYFTPPWAVELLMPFLPRTPRPRQWWEPAAGRGDIAQVLERHAERVLSTDLAPHVKPLELRSPILPMDFLKAGPLSDSMGLAILTNPPYGAQGALADKFLRHALALTHRRRGMVAMLLPHAYDAGKTRVDLFENCPAFAAKITLLDRIRWTNLPQSKHGPEKNHAWYVWEWDSHLQQRRPRIAWAKRAAS